MTKKNGTKKSESKKTDSDLVADFKKARRVSTPIVAINTPDPAATIQAICEAVNGESAKIEWDLVRGMTPKNNLGKEAITKLFDSGMDETKFSPVMAATVALKLPRDSILFIHLANRWLEQPGFVQAVWNLRDKFKSDRRTLVLLGPSIVLPAELSGDVVSFDEPLPDAKALDAVVRDIHKAAKMTADEPTVATAIEALQGLPSFQAEQVVAMSLTKEGLDIDALWERKRRQIEQTPGLKVFRDGQTFEQIGGVEVIKDFLRRVMTGQSRPNAVVFIDEIEKMLAGSQGDTSGVSQDQLGSLLSYMQDQEAAGLIFIGPPGAAKSAVAKAAGNEAGIPTIQLDLGGSKGSLVGQSEQNLRTALKVITSVSNGQSLWIATCNSIADLPPELRRRFTLGTFFFDLPTDEERYAIWKIYKQSYQLSGSLFLDQHQPDLDEGWTGAEIKQCCDIAYRLGCDLTDAARFIVPVSRSAAKQIENLRKQADGRFLSASVPGVYRCAEKQEFENETSRDFAFAEAD